VTEEDAAEPEERFLVFAPIGRDAPLTCKLLASANLRGHVCADIDEVCRRLSNEGAAGLMIAEEALGSRALSCLRDVLARQSAWSDVPILVFTGTPAALGPRPPLGAMLEWLGNVTLLERPLRPITMLSAARSALRARRRQYIARAELQHQQRAVKERDQFLAMLGHELRNPLSAIGMALNLEAEHGGAKYREIMRRQVAHLGRLVDDLLDVSRVTSGKISLRREHVDLVALTERCLLVLRPVVQAHGTMLDYVPPSDPVWVLADTVRLEQIIGNLVTNASKYTAAGGQIDVHVRAEGDEAVLEVRDTGVGIAPEMLTRVFDLFAQVEGTLDRAKGGMGIGLTLVRSLVELHGGTVGVASPGLGGGSVFSVRLPRVERAATALEAAEERARTDGADARAAGLSDVLVVEDNHDSRELLSMILTRRGHRVFTAADGPSGVDEALARKPRVVLIDIGLPGLDGYGVARQVRAALGASVLLVATTGYGQPDDQQRALSAGFDLHLTKPIDIGQLERLLDAPRERAS